MCHCLQFFFAVSGAGNTTSLVMVLTELTGLYAISSVLLIRKQLPLKYRYQLNLFHVWCKAVVIDVSVGLTLLYDSAALLALWHDSTPEDQA